MTNLVKAKGFDIFDPKYVIRIYFVLSLGIILMKLLGGATNGYFITTLAILSILFVLITIWNERYLSWALLLGAVLFILLQYLPLSEDEISVLNDIITIIVFNFTIFWALRNYKIRNDEKKHKELMQSGENGNLYQALEDSINSEWFYNMTEKQAKKFWDAIESLQYPGAPRREDYEDEE